MIFFFLWFVRALVFGYVCMSACSSVCFVLPKWRNKDILESFTKPLDPDSWMWIVIQIAAET